jgi:hypothetical protein
MTSFRILVSPSRRAAARFVTQVRRAFQLALAEEKIKNGLTQSAIARTIGVHRSVINRELVGRKDITVGRIGELAWAMGRTPFFALPKSPAEIGMVPIKPASIDILQPPATINSDANQTIMEEWRKQAAAQGPTPIRLVAA